MGEVCLDDENRRNHQPRKASLGPMGGQSRRKPSRTALNIAWGGHEHYCAARSRGSYGKCRLRNLDDVKHEFAGHELIEKVFTRKVEITDPSGDLVAEIKGYVREIEVGPHREVEWFIVPVQTGENLEMICEIEGHKEAGMFGTVTIH